MDDGYRIEILKTGPGFIQYWSVHRNYCTLKKAEGIRRQLGNLRQRVIVRIKHESEY